MRTTLTIDDDVMAKLRTRAFVEKDRSFKEIVNDTLRLGLNVRETVARAGKFTVRSRKPGTFSHLNYDNVAELIDQVEGSQE